MSKLEVIIPTIRTPITPEKMTGLPAAFIERWAGRPAVDCCVASLKKFAPAAEIDIKIVDGRDGWVPAVNRAFVQSKNDVLLLNDDVIFFYGDWLDELKKYPGDIRGCKLIYPTGILAHAGASIDAAGRGYNLATGEIDLGQWEFSYEPVYVCFAAVLIKKKVIQKVGLMDENFIAGYFDDVDYCIRAREAGFKICYTPTTVIHLEGLTFANSEIAKENYTHNWKYFRQKWLGRESIRRVMVSKNKSFLKKWNKLAQLSF